MCSQITDTVLLIRPKDFRFNAETAASNAFMSKEASLGDIAGRAEAEFESLANALREHGVRVLEFTDDEGVSPDAVFPNNWVSFHGRGIVALYPMLAPSRRREVRTSIIDQIEAETGQRWPVRVDMTSLVQENAFLEGTGSVVLDRPNRIAFACMSPRTTAAALQVFEARLGYEVVSFDAFDEAGRPLYHTNVMMSITEGTALVCLECVPEKTARRVLRERLQRGGRTVLELTMAQIQAFAGNALALRGQENRQFLFMSKHAAESLTGDQTRTLEVHAKIVAVPVPTIETVGGGSVRCMIAEVHGTQVSNPQSSNSPPSTGRR